MMPKNHHCVSTLIFIGIIICIFLIFYDNFVTTKRFNYDISTNIMIPPDITAYIGKTNLNDASIEDICQISGIGEKTALLIIEERERLDGFVIFEQVDEISGIGEKRLEDIKKLFYIQKDF